MKFTYKIGTTTKTINAKPLTTILQKTRGLMFKSKSPPLLFIFNKQKKLTIHSFFCRPFTAIWLDKNKRATKIENIKPWMLNVSGKGKYLLEIPTQN